MQMLRRVAHDVSTPRPGTVCLLGLLLVALLLTVGNCGAAEPDATDTAAREEVAPFFPEELGSVVRRFEGATPGPRVFIIGEEHVSLDVQQAVARALGFLQSAFGVDAVGSEGFSGRLPLPPNTVSASARYAAARAEFLGRNINAVEYAALIHPEIEVYGVSDPEAYREHGEHLDALDRRSEQWQKDFREFIEDDLGSLRVTQSTAEALREALDERDLKLFGERLCGVTGEGSGVCDRCRALVGEWQEIGEEQEAVLSPGTPLMARRDAALAARTVEYLEHHERIALVVGYFHLEGIEEELRQRNVSHWVVVPPGVGPDSGLSKEDREVWRRWDGQEPIPLESWLEEEERKPPAAMTREWFRSQHALFGGLVETDHLLRRGHGQGEVIRLLAQATFPVNFQVEQCVQIQRGHRIRFTVDGQIGYAYFTDGAPPKIPSGYTELKQGRLPGDRFYLVVAGGSGNPPPPVDGPPVTAQVPGDDGPFRRIRAAITRQRETNPRAVTIAFVITGNELWRLVGDQKRPLYALPDRVRRLRRRLETLPLSPEKVEVARELAELLFQDIDDDLPAGQLTVLHQVFSEDLLGTYSLRFLAELSDHPVASRLRRAGEVYVTDPSNPYLEEVLSTPSRPVEIDRTAVWIADDLRSRPGYAELVGTLEAIGARVNAPLAGEETLLVVGSPESDWVLSRADGEILRTGSDRLRQDLAAAREILTVGVGLSAQDTADTRQLQTIDASSDQVLTVIRRIVESIAEQSGQMSLDALLRQDGAEEIVEFRNAVREGRDWEGIVEAIAPTAEHATQAAKV